MGSMTGIRLSVGSEKGEASSGLRASRVEVRGGRARMMDHQAE
jgi:hypothetical protein